MISSKTISIILALYVMILTNFAFASSLPGKDDDIDIKKQDDTQSFVIYPSNKKQLTEKRNLLLIPEPKPIITDNCNNTQAPGASNISIENKINMVEKLPDDQLQNLNIPISNMNYSFFFDDKELNLIQESREKKNILQ